MPLAETAIAGSVEPDQANTCEGKQEQYYRHSLVFKIIAIVPLRHFRVGCGLIYDIHSLANN